VLGFAGLWMLAIVPVAQYSFYLFYDPI